MERDKAMMTLIQRRIAQAGIFSMFLLLISCELNIPIKEMATAKLAISRAVEVKADKYAPEELKKAEEYLYRSHDLIEKKDDKKSKEEAVNSRKAADEAILKSLPLLAKDSLDQAKALYAEDEKLNAEAFAPEEYAAAGKLIGEADALYGGNQFWESYEKSEEAIRYASSAKTASLDRASEIRARIEQLKTDAESLKANRGEEFAAEDLKSVSDNLVQAEALIEPGSLKEAVARVDAADAALKAAADKTYRALAGEKLKIAEESYNKTQESEFKDEFAGETGRASVLIAESRTALENSSYDESLRKSGEAEEILSSVLLSEEAKARAKKDAEVSGTAIRKGETRESTEVEAPEEKATREYVVRYNPGKRDCLWRISLQVYNDAKLWPLIYIANRDKIKDPDLIFPGQKLVIPPLRAVKKGSDAAALKEKVEKTAEGAGEVIEEKKEDVPSGSGEVKKDGDDAVINNGTKDGEGTGSPEDKDSMENEK
jgi:nucleoid-associated protein YgaU